MGGGASTDKSVRNVLEADSKVSDAKDTTGVKQRNGVEAGSKPKRPGGAVNIRGDGSTMDSNTLLRPLASGKEVTSDQLKTLALGQKGYKDEHRDYDSTLSGLHQKQDVQWTAAQNAAQRKDSDGSTTSKTRHASIPKLGNNSISVKSTGSPTNRGRPAGPSGTGTDRKSTRLNSSHG